MIPVERGCLASIENFEKFMKELILKHFPQKDTTQTWSLLYKCRNNSKFFKEQFLGFLKENIPSNYKSLEYNGDKHVLIDITHHAMCLSVLDHFVEFKKYSLQVPLVKTEEKALKNEEHEKIKNQESNSQNKDTDSKEKEQKVEIELEDIALV